MFLMVSLWYEKSRKHMNKKSFLSHKAYNLRVSSLESTSSAGSGHPTTCLSAADIVAVLFFYGMRLDVHDPQNECNDRFILSKGHAAPLLYAAWKELGVLNDEDLLSLRQFDSVLEGHPTPRVPFVDVATGSLGMGLSMGVGMAFNSVRRSLDYYTYVLLGDSELAEGAIWEAAEIAAYYKLKNLVAFVDVNKLGQRGETLEGYNISAIENKFKAFGWKTYTVDGHNIDELVTVCDEVRVSSSEKPQIILAKTVKGYGIQEIEGKNGFHGKVFNKENLKKYEEELKNKFYSSSWTDEQLLSPTSLKKCEKKSFKEVELPLPSYKKGDFVAPRDAFGDALVLLGNASSQIMCLDAEVSNSTRTDKFAQLYPEKFIECFIAEQNMVGMAIGLAARNNVPYLATFAAFLTRAFDQLRMGAISRQALRVIGTHVGTEIGADGPSQMGLEDIAMMRSLPDSIVLYPCDAVSAYKLTGLVYNYTKGISYLRITRGSYPVIYENDETFSIGDCHLIRHSDNDCAVIIGAGATLHEALKAYEQLKRQKIFVAVVDLYSIKPLPVEQLENIFKNAQKNVVVVEDHYAAGGIGEALSSVFYSEKFKMIRLNVSKIPRSGTKEALFSWAKIDVHSIVLAVKQMLK
jgi:transketolase